MAMKSRSNMTCMNDEIHQNYQNVVDLKGKKSNIFAKVNKSQINLNPNKIQAKKCHHVKEEQKLLHNKTTINKPDTIN